MPVDPSTNLIDLDPAGAALGEFQNVHEDFEQFFGEVFDQLHSLSLDLFARHKSLELPLRHSEREPDAAKPPDGFCRASELRELQAEIRANREAVQRVLSELGAVRTHIPRGFAGLRKIQEELRRFGTEFTLLRKDIERDRSGLHELQTAIRAELAELKALR